MKALILTTFVLAAVACSVSSDAQHRKIPAPAVPKVSTLEDKLATLKSCGIALAPSYTIRDLLQDDDRQSFEKPGFDSLLITLGASEEEPERKLAINVWYFDTETIYENGDYKLIAERLAEMTQGSLLLQDVKDHVDCNERRAWVSFRFKGRPMKMNLKVNGDWVDPTIFTKFVELLNESDPSKIYLYYDLGGGQDCVLSCVKKTEFDCLQNQGIKFVPLTGATNFGYTDPVHPSAPRR